MMEQHCLSPSFSLSPALCLNRPWGQEQREHKVPEAHCEKGCNKEESYRSVWGNHQEILYIIHCCQIICSVHKFDIEWVVSVIITLFSALNLCLLIPLAICRQQKQAVSTCHYHSTLYGIFAISYRASSGKKSASTPFIHLLAYESGGQYRQIIKQ